MELRLISVKLAVYLEQGKPQLSIQISDFCVFFPLYLSYREALLSPRSRILTRNVCTGFTFSSKLSIILYVCIRKDLLKSLLMCYPISIKVIILLKYWPQKK